MRNILILLAAVFVIFSCSVDSIYESPTDNIRELSSSLSTKTTFSLDSGVYYHDATGLILQEYDIFDNPQVFRVEEHIDGITHLGIKFFPKNMSEQNLLSRTDVTDVSYIPFGYSPVSPERVTPDNDTSTLPSFPEKNPYVIDKSKYRYISQTWKRDVSTTIQLPIMYALWPVNETLPESIEYEVCFQTIIPEEENTLDRAPDHRQYNLRLVSYDALLDREVPLGNVKVMLTYDMSDVYSALFELYIDILLSALGAIHHYLGTTGEMWASSFPTTFTSVRTSNTTEYEIHRAVDHYFNANHSLSQGIPTNDNQITIHAMNNADMSLMALTSFDIEQEDINIYVYNGYNSQNDCVASVLHELGHTRMLKYRNYAIQSCSLALIESYASFIGWYLGDDYYTSKGFVFPNTGYEISYQGRQGWMPGYGPYTPFFVDLIDDYNQPAINDPITGFSPEAIDSLGLNYDSITDCVTFLCTNYPADSLSNYGAYYTGL